MKDARRWVLLLVLLIPAFGGESSFAAQAGCPSPAGPLLCAGTTQAPFVTPSQAEAAMAALWSARERALDSRETGAIARLETGTAAQSDIEGINNARCGCGRFLWTKGPRAFEHATIYMPSQTHYPLFFITDVDASISRGEVQGDAGLFIVTRSRPGQPWKIAVEIYDNVYKLSRGAPFGPPYADSQGYDQTVPSTPSVATAKNWFDKLVAYYEGLKRTGRLPAASPFTASPLTTGTGIQARPNGYATNGIRGDYDFRVRAGSGPWVFTVGRTPYACSEILETARSTPGITGEVLLQPPTRHGWGYDVPPGRYREIDETYEWATCIHQVGSKLAVTGTTYGFHAHGIPA